MKVKTIIGIAILIIILIILIAFVPLYYLENDEENEDEYEYYHGYNGYRLIYDYEINYENRSIVLDAFNNSANITITRVKHIMRDCSINFNYTCDMLSEEISRFYSYFTLNIDYMADMQIIYFTPNSIQGGWIPNNISNEYWNRVETQKQIDEIIVEKYTNSLISHLEEILGVTASLRSYRVTSFHPFHSDDIVEL